MSPATSGRRVLVGTLSPADDGSWGAAAHRAVTKLQGPTFHAEFRDVLPERLEDDWNLVVGHGMEFAAALERLAMMHPGVQFLLTDDRGPEERLDLPNLRYIDWGWEEGAFLAGVLASHLSTSGIVGILGGIACNTQSIVQTAFVRGARLDRVDTVVLTAQTGSFLDKRRGYRMANALFDEGVDVLLHTADSCGRGAIEAAQYRGRTMIGFLNEGDLSHECVSAFIATDVEEALRALISAKASDTPVGGVARFGIASGYQRFDLKSAVSRALRQRIEELMAMITANPFRARTPDITTQMSLKGC